MEENNIMTNEEVSYDNDVTYTDESTDTEGKGFGWGTLVGAAVAVGSIFAYKKIVKPLAAKIKSKKEVEVKSKNKNVIDVDAEDVVECNEEDCE